MAYYPRMHVVTIDVNGAVVPTASEDINLTVGDTSIVRTTDTDGYLEGGTIAGAAGDQIELSHDTYTEILRLKLGQSPEDALERNRVITYILEDLYPTIAAKTVEIYIQDQSSPDNPPRYVGTAPVNSNFKIPVDATVARTIRVFPRGLTPSLVHPINSSFETDNYADVDIAARGPQTLFDHHADETTVGTSEEVLYTDTIPGQTLFYTDDKLVAEYSGVFAATADDKQILLDFAGQSLFDSGILTENAKDWKLNLTMFRVSNTSVRYVVQFSSAVHWEPVYGVLTGIDLYDDNALVLSADDEVAGGTTAKIAYGQYIPSIGTTTDYVTYHGEIVMYGGEPVTYP